MELNGKRVLVTGGAGLIGSTIIDQLIAHEQPAEIIVLDNLVRGTMLNLENSRRNGNVRFVETDIRDAKAIRPHFEGVEAVFHQAAIRITLCAEQPRECLEVLMDGTFNVLEACVDAGVKKVVAASSASVYGAAESFPTREDHHPFNNRTMYGAAKVANEGMLRSFHEMYSLPYVALRYFNVYGPRMDVFGKYTEVLIRWLDCIDRGERPKIFGDGQQSMDFIYSEDVARANILAMRSATEDAVFNVGSGVETTLLGLLEAVLEVTGSSLEPEFLAERKVNPVPRRLADTTAAAEILGFKAEIDVARGIRNLIEWRRGVIARGQREAYEGTQPA